MHTLSTFTARRSLVFEPDGPRYFKHIPRLLCITSTSLPYSTMMMQKINTLPRSGARPQLPLARGPASHRRVSPVTAALAEKNGFAKWSDSVGMPTDDGVFGFTPFAEMWVGRWAQLGFVSSIVAEFVTGRGTLQQIGLPSPSTEMLIALCAVFGTATLAGTVRTVQRATAKQMSRSEIDRYKNFLGLNKEDDWMEEASAMKRKGDFTTPGNNQAVIDATKAQGSPVDSFLSTNEIAEGQAAAQEMRSAGVATMVKDGEAEQVTAEQQLQQARAAAAKKANKARMYAEAMYFGEQGELEYARGIEITNGRWAMIGFLTAVLVEAYTGEGIIGQVISILKMSGLLGERSGF